MVYKQIKNKHLAVKKFENNIGSKIYCSLFHNWMQKNVMFSKRRINLIREICNCSATQKKTLILIELEILLYIVNQLFLNGKEPFMKQFCFLFNKIREHRCEIFFFA